MNYIDHFINSHKPLIKPRYVAVEEDLVLVHKVFPEPGFRSYFCGHIISKLAQELRKNGITTYQDRESRPEFTSLTRFLSNIRLTGEEIDNNVRRGTGSTCEAGASSSGVATDNACTPASGSGESKEDCKESSEARPQPARPLDGTLSVPNKVSGHSALDKPEQ